MKIFFRKVIAIAEKGDPPSITIYDVATLKKRRQLVLPPEKPTTVIKISLSEVFVIKELFLGELFWGVGLHLRFEDPPGVSGGPRLAPVELPLGQRKDGECCQSKQLQPYWNNQGYCPKSERCWNDGIVWRRCLPFDGSNRKCLETVWILQIWEHQLLLRLLVIAG